LIKTNDKTVPEELFRKIYGLGGTGLPIKITNGIAESKGFIKLLN
jgi:hypothetical protein